MTREQIIEIYKEAEELIDKVSVDELERYNIMGEEYDGDNVEIVAKLYSHLVSIQQYLIFGDKEEN